MNTLHHLNRVIDLAIIATIGICIILLFNFTAPNPTGRRYSSESPLLSSGPDAERILSADLRLPNNNRSDQRQCICSSTGAGNPSQCRACIARVAVSGGRVYRIPDFASATYLADSKNQVRMRANADDFDQIKDVAAAAKSLDIPLYIFIRVDTQIDDAYFPVVASTGGAIIRYFTTPSYVDPVDHGSKVGLAGMSVLGIARVGIRSRRRQRNSTPPPRIRIPVNRSSPDPVTKAERAITAAEDFQSRSREKLE